jgi:hypothetical protein
LRKPKVCSSECEGVFGHHDLRVAEDGIAEGHVDAERLPAELCAAPLQQNAAPQFRKRATA